MLNSNCSRREIVNFGLNVRFAPSVLFQPKSVDELLRKLRSNQFETIRVIGSKHAWNLGIQSDELLVDLKHLDTKAIERNGQSVQVTVGAGCVLSELVTHLNLLGYALPTSGLILEQTIAGATATGTHGSGKPSLSHYISAAKVVYFENGSPVARWIHDGDELSAIRCSMGCLGIVVEVRLPLIKTYHITEDTVRCRSMSEAVKMEQDYPLQQIFLLPLGWQIYTQRRKVCDRPQVSATSWLYRKYWNWGLCLCFLALMKCMLFVPLSKVLLRFYYRSLAPLLLITGWRVSDRSDRLMIIQHETFRHLEMELFVRSERLVDAMDFLIDIVSLADDKRHALTSKTTTLLRQHCLQEAAESIKGIFTHHCPICIRKVLADDTLISMTAGDDAWYSISLITYQEPRDSFYALAEFLADSFHKCFLARAHWGKWFPYDSESVEQQFEKLDRFREIALRFDPEGRFRNSFIERTLGISDFAKRTEQEASKTVAGKLTER